MKDNLFEYVEKNPAVLSEHAKWLDGGGKEILDRLTDMVRGDAFPYTAETHVQASFGAFVGGVSWAVRVLSVLVGLSNDKTERARMVAQSGGSLNEHEMKILEDLYGYINKEQK